MGIILAVLVLGLVVALHELGHFLVAKWCGVGVLEYSLGFGTALWSKRFGETKYSLRAIPLGGYVRMAGDDPIAVAQGQAEIDAQKAISDSERVHVLEEAKAENVGTALGSPEHWGQDEPDECEQRLLTDKTKWFLLKPVWKKAAIVCAGPLANLVSALLISIVVLSVWGATVPVNLPVIGQLMPNYPAAKAGIKTGDKVVSIDGNPIKTWEELASTILNSGGRELSLHIERTVDVPKPEELDLKVTGMHDSSELAFIDKSLASSGYKIGIGAAGQRERVGFVEAVELGSMHIARLADMSVRGIVGLVIGAISLKNIGGPIFIFGETMRSAHQGIADLLEFVVFLSVSLGILNLMPVPVLDGGHLFFFLIEAVKGKPVSMRVVELSQRVGMVLLLLLTVLAVGNDVVRLVHGG